LNVNSNRSKGNGYQRDNSDENGNKSGKFSDNNDYLDIWRVNPSYRDINSKHSQIRGISVIILISLLFYLTYQMFNNLILSIGIAAFFSIGLFFEQLLKVYQNISNVFHDIIRVDPFEDFKICKLVEDPDSILIINEKTATNIITRIFEVEILPENVKSTYNQFLIALNNSELEYTYQVVQKPMINLIMKKKEDDESSKINSFQIANSGESFKTSIYFSVSYRLNGVLRELKMRELMETISKYSNSLKSEFSANFHHTKIALLSGMNLINAIRTLTFNQAPEISGVKEEYLYKRGYLARLLFKMMIILITLGYLWFVLISLKIHPLFVVVSESVLILFWFLVWWRDILYGLSSGYLKRSTMISAINPFGDITFYQQKSCNDILFVNTNNKLLTAIKTMNIGRSIQPTLAYPDKFFRALNNHHAPYIYTLFASPISSHTFAQECLKSINERTYEALDGIAYRAFDKPSPKIKHPRIEFDNWLQMRSGVWKTILTISTFSFKFIHELDVSDFVELATELDIRSSSVKDAFENNFIKLQLGYLRKKLHVSGFIGGCLKNVNFDLTGTGLTYLYFQGKNLIHLSKISSEHKKGLDTMIAAEFNTPIHLSNHAIIGKTFNTEFLEEETPLGFTLQQYKSLLITNGIAQDRELAKMKIAAELIRTQKSCVIFDFTGDWSKLIRYFEDTPFEDKFLHFKLGTTFNVNLSQSGIKHDKKNIEYLSLFYDAFALAYKEQKITIEALKKSVSKDENLDLDPLLLDFKYDSDFKPYNKDNRLINLLNELTNQTIVFSEGSAEFEENINPIDFIKNEKSIIIDLSILKDLENKVFISFVILSKFIHYINNFPDYKEKIIILPNVDAFFDANYLDSNYNAANYGKIGKFLEPLRRNGFGLIFSANQIRYLHPNFLNYIQNILAFRATDVRDIAVLKNQMNLQELQGSGYYSSKRNNTYQIDYLKNLRESEVIVKRADINQPFPGVIAYDWFFNSLPLTRDKIIQYMERQGYNVKRAERIIKDQAKKTLFEKDFGLYSHFLADIVNFLGNIKTVDNVGQLYKGRLKEELLKHISESSKRRNYDQKQIKEIRDDIFNTLVKHGYLVESHPKRASGAESMRTSFAVGPKYKKALKDYYESQDSSMIKYEPVDLESEPTIDIIEGQSDPEGLDPVKIKSALAKHFVDIFYYEYFIMHKNMMYKKYEKMLKAARNLFPNYLHQVYQEYYGTDYTITSEDVSKFIDKIGNFEEFPFTGEDLRQFLISIKNFEVNESENVAEVCKRCFDAYTPIFNGFKQFIEGSCEVI